MKKLFALLILGSILLSNASVFAEKKCNDDVNEIRKMQRELDNEWINDLKLRAKWGTGGVAVGTVVGSLLTIYMMNKCGYRHKR